LKRAASSRSRAAASSDALVLAGVLSAEELEVAAVALLLAGGLAEAGHRAGQRRPQFRRDAGSQRRFQQRQGVDRQQVELACSILAVGKTLAIEAHQQPFDALRQRGRLGSLGCGR
jgi:hypothetical protein